MKKLGFVKDCTIPHIDPAHFFFANTPQFLRMLGFNPNPNNCSYREHDDHNRPDLCINIRRTLIPAASCNDLWIVAHDIHIELSKPLVEVCSIGDPELHTERLWCYFGKHLRLWYTETVALPAAELIPIDVLRSMPDTEYVCKSFDSLYDNSEWTGEELVRNYDAGAIGIYLAGFMNSDEAFLTRVHPSEIGEIIFSARANNWEKLTALH
ncbi:MAG: hypothetical protein V4524_02955 [Patescibacteria group bacterium]